MKHLLANRIIQWILVLLLVVLTVGGTRLWLFPNMESEQPSFQPSKSIPTAEETPVVPPAETAHKPLSKRVIEYHMSVDYAVDRKELNGQQVFTWKNPGTQPVRELYMHLYPNAFSSMKTTFMTESGGKLRQDKVKENSFGSMDLLSIRTENGEDLLPRIQYVQPDDGNWEDRTLVKIPLNEPVGPGEKVTLRTQFLVKLPAVFARMGTAGDFVMAGQWFPKVAVYEPAETRGRTADGWNLHQYHGNSEFYADFGTYDVKIKVPSSYVVAATGFPTKRLDDGQTKTYQFYADDVHDFAWSASPNFVYVEEPFSGANIPGVKIKLYLDPKHEPLKTRYMSAAKKALSRYSQWYGTYPYSTLSVVVPPEDGNGAGGMEYPTLITAWGASDDKPGPELERVLAHEIGHQFWYGLVATNEFEEAWLDEGLTSYTEDRFMEVEYGVSPDLPLESSYITSPAPLKQNSWEYRNDGEYADNVYTRAKLVLKAIENQVGQKTMDRILKQYFTKWKFKHPTSSDFQQVVEEVTKNGWDDFFKQYVYGGLMSNYAVESVQVQSSQKDGGTVYESSVIIRKLGGTVPSVPIRFHFTDGTSIDKAWDGKDERIEYKLSHSAPVDWVRVDPDHSLVLENKHMNNYWQTNVNDKAKVRWNLGITEIINGILKWVGW
ncbi:peptidase family M1 [Paenibacillus larvae subsp. larvae]|uniref:M1 family metallopeptidase n=1 Tax=Paenibacillus larvae TaxID=1464 RepID=UPI00098E88E6|nr:M1 family metallopeptidase [Paenibacillus larvae]AQT84843.1 EnpEP protein [Paenibacillus larvae subsp. pulvifaciens]AQZ46842.1 EnpEP protein [Paenibacillus larvae subsp. pulvifaciens]AVF33108.1 peptidase family M1 [Paenibacillus larvae subsp. larvae]MBH0344506.1 EnpEP protein [Paenibacillus larvae]MCY7520131.1 M1 family metallopeptidase [Paenibacillus larvae]